MNWPSTAQTKPDIRLPRLLASVNCLTEAELVEALGVDIIDLKDPHNGALGALPTDLIKRIVATLDAASVTSATIGDIDTDPRDVSAAIEAVAATGVNYVKAGVDAGLDFDRLLHAIAPLTKDIKIVLVLFADQPVIVDAAGKAAAVGVHGIMLDTASKVGASLRDYRQPQQLLDFVNDARRHGLLTGLAGSIGLDDIAPLTATGPDYLGFRGALCAGHRRTQAIDPEAVRAVRDRLRTSAHHIHGQGNGRSANVETDAQAQTTV